MSQWGRMIQPHIAYTNFTQLQRRQWDWRLDVVDVRMTERYERWFAQQWLVPLTDPDIPVPRRQEDFPLTGEEEGDDEEEDDEEGDDEDEGDEDEGDEEAEEDDEGEESPRCTQRDEPDPTDHEALQDIPIGQEIASIEEMHICRAAIASQHDYIATLERHNAILRTEQD